MTNTPSQPNSNFESAQTTATGFNNNFDTHYTQSRFDGQDFQDTSFQHQHKDTLSQSVSQSVLSVILVMLESFITLVLRFDANLRQIVYPLAKDNVVVCVRTYVPHLTFYATFTYNGVLLDTQLRANQMVDVTINAFTWQLFSAIFTNDSKAVDKLQMRGEPLRVGQVKRFLQGIGLGQIVQHILQTVKGKTAKAPKMTEDEKKLKLTEYKERITEQQNQINALTISQSQLATQAQELQSKNKTLLVALGVTVVALIGCIIALVMR